MTSVPLSLFITMKIQLATGAVLITLIAWIKPVDPKGNQSRIFIGRT